MRGLTNGTALIAISNHQPGIIPCVGLLVNVIAQPGLLISKFRTALCPECKAVVARNPGKDGGLNH